MGDALLVVRPQAIFQPLRSFVVIFAGLSKTYLILRSKVSIEVRRK